MSRIGKMPIAIPAGVTVEVAENNKVTVKGPKGTLERVLAPEMEIKVEGSEVVVTRPNDLKRISKPGLRVYASKDELPRVLGGLGIAIISTNKGILTDKEARALNVGGEVLAFIW